MTDAGDFEGLKQFSMSQPFLADAKLAALEVKLSRAREVKQGMMSVLLTLPSAAGQAGRVRLV